MKDNKYIPIAVALLIIFLSAGWLVMNYYAIPPSVTKQPLIEMNEGQHEKPRSFSGTGEEIIAVKIYLPSEEGITEQEKNVRFDALPARMTETIIAEYVKALGERLPGVKLQGVYRDRNNIFYIDLSDEFRRGFSGDANYEYNLLKSLFDTVSVNIKEMEDVKLLIEGKEADTIGGHLNSLYPLKEIIKN